MKPLVLVAMLLTGCQKPEPIYTATERTEMPDGTVVERTFSGPMWPPPRVE